MLKTAILLIDCPDRKGIVAAIANFLLARNANIRHADQHQDIDLALFFTRIEFTLDDHSCSEPQLRESFAPLAAEFHMNWRLHYIDARPNVAIFVSHYLHCLADLLFRHQSGELPCNLSLILANHPDAQPLASFYGIPFHHLHVTRENKLAAEQQQLDLLASHHIDLVILARYMQVLSPQFVDAYPQRIINVHHSFLPAFTGAKPYHAAFARGVKLIGATSHYVTADLDEGPIIEQDVIRVAQNDQLASLMQKGRDLERLVLSRAVRWHLSQRILCYANKTVVFS
jgi:formyltetrahydrofolate deformylase